MSNRWFQENINGEIKSLTLKYLADGSNSSNTGVSYQVLQNDGAILAVKMSVHYPVEGCGGGTGYSFRDTIMTYDVINNRKTTARFSKGGYPLYPYTAVIMSVPAINRAISKFEGGMVSDCMNEYSISNIRNGTFVIADGNVAIELLLNGGCVPNCCRGFYRVPLYKPMP
ncbi:MAG: hypothetical protein LBB74_05120 [Chitinispirillales bacterium]|jgi:hypothetical protein|nr:hypothetical protein [Chitinispirillales bacterium]